MSDYRNYLIRQLTPTARDSEDIAAAWLSLEQKYGIRFVLKDGSFRPVNEWLDDLYLKLTPNEVKEMLMDILEKGDILFMDILKHRD